MPTQQNVEKLVGFRMCQEDLAKLERLAEAQERTRSDVLRRLVRQAPDPTPPAKPDRRDDG